MTRRSLLLWCLFLASSLVLLTFVPVHASGGYPYASYNGQGSKPAQSEWVGPDGKKYSMYSYYYRNCTDYVAWKLVSVGVPLKQVTGLSHGGLWAKNAHKKSLRVSESPSVWSAAVQAPTPSNQWGHVAFVEDVYSNGTIKVSEYNYGVRGAYGSRVGTPSQLGFTHFVQFGVGPKANAGEQHTEVEKSVEPDGTQQVYSVSPSGVSETWWRSGQSPQTNRIIEVGGVRDIDKKRSGDGTQAVYAATPDGVVETWWRAGEGLHTARIISHSGVRKVLSEMQGDRHILYVLADDGVYEYSWLAGSSISKRHIVGINNPLAFVKTVGPGGEHQIYTATIGAVYETWWIGSQTAKTSPIIGISQHNIVDIEKQLASDGTQLLYTATSTGVWESWWKNGRLGHGFLFSHPGVRQIEKSTHLGVEQLYVATQAEVKEYWWRPWQPIGSGRIFSGTSIASIDKNSMGDVQQLYVGAFGGVSEVWWARGQMQTTKLIGS